MGIIESSPQKKIETGDKLPHVRTGGLWLMVFRRLFRHRSSRIGMFLLGALFLVAIFAEQIAPYSPTETMIGVEDIKSHTPPCIHLLGCPQSEPQHIMGTDGYVRDFYSRVIYGTRTSLLVSISTVGFALLIGTFLGAIAGYSGGWWNAGIMRLMDSLQAFPVLMLALGMVAVLGPGLQNIIIAIVVAQIPNYARVTCAKVLSLKEKEFIEASRALGAGSFHILFNRILPNTLALLIVMGMLGVSSAILDVAALSFLGFGPDPDIPEWGAMLGAERNQIFNLPYLVVFPGIAIMITVLAFNLLADGLRDSLDPQQTYSDIPETGISK
jgi:ABC-type dipeptide/oligopeptide/nickel transport system permease subunit